MDRVTKWITRKAKAPAVNGPGESPNSPGRFNVHHQLSTVYGFHDGRPTVGSSRRIGTAPLWSSLLPPLRRCTVSCWANCAFSRRNRHGCREQNSGQHRQHRTRTHDADRKVRTGRRGHGARTECAADQWSCRHCWVDSSFRHMAAVGSSNGIRSDMARVITDRMNHSLYRSGVAAHDLVTGRAAAGSLCILHS